MVLASVVSRGVERSERDHSRAIGAHRFAPTLFLLFAAATRLRKKIASVSPTPRTAPFAVSFGHLPPGRNH